MEKKIKPVKKTSILKKTGVLIIEDNKLLREGISTMINEQDNFKIAGAFSEKEKSLSKILELEPEIVLIDIGLRSHNSLKIVSYIKKNSDIKIIVMDLMPVEEDILDFIKEGASGFIFKDTLVKDFLKTITSVAAGKKVAQPQMNGSIFSEIIKRALVKSKPTELKNAFRMTAREKQIVKLLADGQSNKDMGLTLNLSPFTIKSHVHNILEKLALHKRVQIASYVHTHQI